MFVNSPNALMAITQQNAIHQLLQFQSEETGLVDGTGSEEEILGQIRQLIVLLPSNFEDNDSFVECTDDLNRCMRRYHSMCRRYIHRTFQNR